MYYFRWQMIHEVKQYTTTQMKNLENKLQTINIYR